MADVAHRRRSRRRRLMTLAVMMLCGFVINMIVAWTLAWRVLSSLDDPEMTGWFIVKRDDAPNPMIWSAQTASRFGVSAVVSSYGSTLEHYAETDMWDVEEYLSRLSREARDFIATRNAEGLPVPAHATELGIVLYCGWPLRTAYALIDAHHSGAEPHVRGGLLARGSLGERHWVYLPYRPLWLGSIVNSVFYSAAPLVCLALCLGVRRLIRYEKGNCPRCAYDLRRDFSGGCSECGWRRT